ncbi:MAG TPA: D-hexose-6-phosphate mutarotase [Verrucomicrobiaceae bacterium]
MILPNSIRRSEAAPGFPVFEIKHPAATARVALHGAHLMQWTPAGHKPVLYLSPQSVLKEHKAIRGGVPICWPWFGNNKSDANLPAHGMVRNRFWELAEATENNADVRLKFSLRDSAETLRLWPHAFRLTLDLEIGAALRMSLEMTNTGDHEFTATGALHTYLAVGDIRETRIVGLEGAEYLDTVGSPLLRMQEGQIVIDREVDRIYRSSKEVRMEDEVLRRIIGVCSEGSRNIVVWNPWVEKARALSDLPDDAYQKFVCVETANAWEDQVTLVPGATHELCATVQVFSSALQP